jgi:transposase
VVARIPRGFVVSEHSAASPSATPAPRSRAGVRQAWIDRLARFPTSGLSPAAFCAAEGVSLPSFYSWKRRLATEALEAATPPKGHHEAQTVLLPVRVAPPCPAVELLLPCGATLRITPGCDLLFLRSLVDALGGASC